MPDETIHILSTRALPTPVTREAAGHGIVIDTLPFIATHSLQDQSLSDQLQELARRRIVAIFTSRNAVKSVAALLPPDVYWTIFCMGSVTRASVAAALHQSTIADTADTAAALAGKIIQAPALKNREIFFFCGDQRREDLPSLLTDNGFQVKELIVYTTIATPHPLRRPYQGIIFFSPSAVSSFFSVNTLETVTPLFSIGPTTAAAIRAHCTNPVFSGKTGDTEQLIHQVINYFQHPTIL